MRKVKPKPKCCKSAPRCKRCPVLLQRIEAAGLAERTAKGNYRVSADLTKRDLKRFRKRAA